MAFVLRCFLNFHDLEEQADEHEEIKEEDLSDQNPTSEGFSNTNPETPWKLHGNSMETPWKTQDDTG